MGKAKKKIAGKTKKAATKKTSSKKKAVKKTAARKPVAKKAAARKTVKKKPSAKKAPPKKKVAKKAIAKKALKKKTTSKRAAPKKKAAKKAVPKKKAAKKVAMKKTVAKKKVVKRAVKKSARSIAKKGVPAVKKKAAKKALSVTKKVPAQKPSILPEEKVAQKEELIEKGVSEATAPEMLEEREKPFTGKSRVNLMVVDPYKLFAYWEIDTQEFDKAVRDGKGYITTLRIYIFEKEKQFGFIDLPVPELTGNKYIDVIPERGYRVDFGVLKDDEFHSITQSERKYTPSFKIHKEDLTMEEIEMLREQMPSLDERLSS